MTSADERRKRAQTMYRKEKSSFAPRKITPKAEIGVGGYVDLRLDKARTICALLYGWMESAEYQERRRLKGLSWAPKEKYRDVEQAGTLLKELIEDMRGKS